MASREASSGDRKKRSSLGTALEEIIDLSCGNKPQLGT